MSIRHKLLLVFLLTCLVGPAVNAGRYYDSLVNQAELKIVDSNYRQALEFYIRAFREKQYHFAHDLYNAGVCAIEIGDNNQAMHLCTALSKTGVGLNFFLKKSV